jgi:hypothetical protein
VLKLEDTRQGPGNRRAVLCSLGGHVHGPTPGILVTSRPPLTLIRHPKLRVMPFHTKFGYRDTCPLKGDVEIMVVD